MKNKIVLRDNIKLKFVAVASGFQIALSVGLLFILDADAFGGANRLLYYAIFSVLVILTGAGVIGFIAGGISSPVSMATNLMEKLSRGDFSHEMETRRDDEMGRLLMAVDAFVDSLKNSISEISDAGSEINSNADEIASVVEEQNSNMKAQSDSVTQITTTVEELSASSKQVAAYSDQVFDIAEQGLNKAENGVRSIERTMGEMQRIIQDSRHKLGDIVELGKKSQEISSVMGIINSIADQTKLIAFNAALEASSAGEAGKRFGVVAVEIRRLADNVMESTGEIENKISEIQDSINTLTMASEKSSVEMESGINASSQTVDILKDILEGAKTNRDAAKQISISTKQQETASEQVVNTLREITDGSEKSAESIYLTRNITNNLSELSSKLENMLKNFKFEEEKELEEDFEEEFERIDV